MIFEQHIKASFAGFDGPFFPKVLDKVNISIEKLGHRIHGYFLEELGQQIPGFQKVILGPKTEDDYCWFAGLYFEKWSESDKRAGLVIVLLPRRKNSASKQRSIAAYAKGVSEHEAEEVVNQLATVIAR